MRTELHPRIILSDEINGNTFPTKSSTPTDSVEIVLRPSRQIIVYDQGLSGSMIEHNSSVSGVVLEDFDTSFINKFYHSHLDNPSNINSSSIAAASIMVAHALYIPASDGSSLNLIVLNSIKINVSLVEELVGCLLTCEPGSSCDIVKQFISPSNICLSHYVGVFFVDSPSETQRPEYTDAEEEKLHEFLKLQLDSDLKLERIWHYEVVYLIHEDHIEEVDNVVSKVQDFIKEKKGRIWRQNNCRGGL